MSSSKQQLGKFYTTRVDYILQGFESLVQGKRCIDPFAGGGDLLDWASRHGASETKGWDIDPTTEWNHQDSFADPLIEPGALYLTNPPYLIRGKSEDKRVFDRWKCDDLYKAYFLSHLGVDEGICIVPVNFLSSDDAKCRSAFFSTHQITQCTLFEEQVFDDTPSTVIAFHYQRGTPQPFTLTIQPRSINQLITLESQWGWRFGSDWFEWINRPTEVQYSRIVQGDEAPTSSIYVNCLDGGGETTRIAATLTDEPYYAKLSDRARMSVTCSHQFTKRQQQQIVDRFNEQLETFRLQYHSLFLPNYRQSSSLYARKRIPFKQVYAALAQASQEIINDLAT